MRNIKQYLLLYDVWLNIYNDIIQLFDINFLCMMVYN